MSRTVDNSTYDSGGNLNTSLGWLYNETTYDKQRNNTQGTLLPSAARTTATNSSNQTNYNGRGVILYLNVTANPGGAETLKLLLRHIDPVSGAITSSASTIDTVAATNGIYRLYVYPGASFSDTNNKAVNLPVGRTWAATVSPSGSGSWTYSLAYDQIL